MDQWIDYLDTIVEQELRWNVYKTILIIVGLWLIKKLAFKIIGAKREETELKKFYHWRKTIQYIIVFIGFLLIGNIWINNFQSITTFLGLLSAGIAIALKDIFVNVAGWMFILWRRPFDIGDRIQVGDFKGDVVDTRVFQFSILEVGNWVDAEQSTGRIIHVPNGMVFSMPQANYSQGFDYIWNEQRINISLNSDYKRAKQLLNEMLDEIFKKEYKGIQAALRKAQQDHFISFAQYTPTIYAKIHERGIQLSLRYLCNPRKRRFYEHMITELIIEKFKAEPNVKIVYPTTSVILENGNNMGAQNS
ncbi:mechanosensitive ion channel family protein [Belliella sp. DSM 111904]|uniref:Mechanosensitive ion channel family protein n=1 Tax=Belliella filtrata TaxID=2923435 RepID=A0ABS9V4N9_9BACT|nr:mechanosensitive ion channel domain-containing protein [Belliella filtrata]MCH7411374.1 mechanosensitive ion channel family protein [Belliella filtrata]